MTGPVEQVERQLRRLYAEAADTPSDVDAMTAVAVIARGRARRRRTRLTVAGVAVATLLVAAIASVVPRPADHAPQPARQWHHLQQRGLIVQDAVGVWVDHLPSGPVAHAAWVDGDVLHVGARTIPITDRGISAPSGLVVRARTSTGWFVSVPRGPQGRLGVIHPDGTFVEFQRYSKAVPLLVSPDGTQALAGADGLGDLIDTATGRVVMGEPAIGAYAWTHDGIYADEEPRQPHQVLWKPGVGITRSTFDHRHCRDTGETAASLGAGYDGCTIPGLASVSPDGRTALVRNDVVDLATGRRTRYAPVDPLGQWWVTPGYGLVWEDDEHVLLEVHTPTIPAPGGSSSRPPETPDFAIVRCDVRTGSCERAADPITADEPGLAALR